MAEVDGKKDDKFDEQLYSRQAYAIGAEAQTRLGRTDVLICGVTGTGMEIAKNIILTGVRSVTLFDPKPVQWRDLSSAFYYTSEDVGQNRVDASMPRLQELNKYVAVKKLEGAELTNDALSHWKTASVEQHPLSQQVVVFVDHPTTHLKEVNKFCRQAGIKFICAESRGVSGCIFVDDGPSHTVYDPTGEENKTLLITAMGAVGVRVNEDHRHELSDGDSVSFTDLPDFPEMNNESADVPSPKLFQVKVTGPFSFTLVKDGADLDLSQMQYKRGGYVTRVRQPIQMAFSSLEVSAAEPEFLITDFAKFDAPGMLHLLFLALHDFEKQHGDLPAPHNPDHSAEVVRLAREHLSSFPNAAFDADVVERLAAVSSGNLNPIASMIGGFAAHEVLKAASGKFTPINQWFYFDAREVLLTPAPAPETCQPLGNRYDGLSAVFGREFQERLKSSKFFVVGSGALGCEFLKNFALMGVGCSEEGKVVVTDMDGIEKSNLSRQFLFRPKDIGELKSKVAAEAARAMNPDLNVQYLTEKVAPDTEHIFDDKFWESLDCVTNALDNVQARLYVDSRCVQFRKPLLESGTLGSQGNVQVVVPHVTESYGSSRDPPEKTVPFCTLKNFPNAIEHTIQWSRDIFEGMYTNVPRDVNCYINDATFLQQLEKEPSTRITTLLAIEDALGGGKPSSFQDCIQWARMKFDEMFSNDIRTLLHNFPVDQVTTTGEPFWSGAKRPPTPLVVCTREHDTSVTRAHHHLHPPPLTVRRERRDARVVHLPLCPPARECVQDHPVGQRPGGMPRLCVFSPHPRPHPHAQVASFAGSRPALHWEAKKVTIQVEENQKVDATVDVSTAPEDIEARLPARDGLTFNLGEASFEKDDDSNHHVDFITACSNLRARNYKIPEADRNKTKLIAGKVRSVKRAVRSKHKRKHTPHRSSPRWLRPPPSSPALCASSC